MKTSLQAIQDFLAQSSLAIVGVSRSGKKFGNSALRELVVNGYRLFPVHPTASVIGGLTCYPSLKALPEPVGGLVMVVPPHQTELLLQEAADVGISRVWMQQGSSSEAAVAFCADHGITEVHGQCILMFLKKGPAIHRFHHRLWRVFGLLPR